MWKLGSNSIGKIYLGSNAIGKAYLGSNLVFQKGGSQYSRLPNGYTELSYVGTNEGHAWIDTGVAGANDLEITTRFSVSSLIQYAAIYGNYVDESHLVNRLILNTTSSIIVGGGNNLSTSVSNFSLNRVHTITVTSSSAILESTSTTINSASMTANTTNICLGASKVTSPPARAIGLRIYSFRIKKNGSAILNLVPAKRDSDSAIGFYDLANSSFVKSETGTSFTAGPIAEYSGRMLLALHWDGTDNPSSSKWYDKIGNQYYTLTNGTHTSGYYEFLNSSPSSATAYAALFGALPDLGYHWKMVVDMAVKITSGLSSYSPIDFGAMGDSGTDTCAVGIMLSTSSNRWYPNTKFNGNDSISTYSIDASSLVEPEYSNVGTWVRRTFTVGVTGSSTTGKDGTIFSVSSLGNAVSATPYNQLRFNRWDASKTNYIGRSLVNPSGTYKYATSTRVYSIKIYYEPII